MSEIYQKTYKIIILGEGSVGKTSLIKRFVNNEFNLAIATTLGINDYSKIVSIEDYNINLSIWDTAGQECYKSIVPLYFRGCKAAVIVYDITQEDSFKNVQYWVDRTRELGSKDIMFMLIGNKVDRENRIIKTKDALEKAKQNSMLFFETSCLNAFNVDLAFQELVKALHETEQRSNPTKDSAGPSASKGISLIEPKTASLRNSQKNKSCCAKKST